MPIYQTTKPIKSLAKGGVNLAARQPVTPQAFTAQHWQALLDEGVIVEVKPVTAVAYDTMTLDELKAIADKNGVAYTWNIKRETLIERLEAVNG